MPCSTSSIELCSDLVQESLNPPAPSIDLKSRSNSLVISLIWQKERQKRAGQSGLLAEFHSREEKYITGQSGLAPYSINY